MTSVLSMDNCFRYVRSLFTYRCLWYLSTRIAASLVVVQFHNSGPNLRAAFDRCNDPTLLCLGLTICCVARACA